MDYNKQATDFLHGTNTKLEIVVADKQTAPQWAKEGEKHGIQYKCTLSNKNHSYTFDFWGSVRDAELLTLAREAKERGFDSSYHFAFRDALIKRNIKVNAGMRYRENKFLLTELMDALKPTAYDVLACLSPLYEDTLEDFCSSYGYDADSRTAERIFNACKEQDRNLRKLFTHAEIDQLTEIQ